MQNIVEIIEEHTLPIVDNLGLKLWGIEVLPGSKILVRIYLDGAGIEECAKVSRLLGLVLDIEEPFSSAWILEVSTPGIDRQFFKLSQLEEYLEERVHINFITPLSSCTDIHGNPLKKVEAVVKSLDIENNSFVVSMHEGHEANVSWEDVKKIKLLVEHIEISKLDKK